MGSFFCRSSHFTLMHLWVDGGPTNGYFRRRASQGSDQWLGGELRNPSEACWELLLISIAFPPSKGGEGHHQRVEQANKGDMDGRVLRLCGSREDGIRSAGEGHHHHLVQGQVAFLHPPTYTSKEMAMTLYGRSSISCTVRFAAREALAKYSYSHNVPLNLLLPIPVSTHPFISQLHEQVQRLALWTTKALGQHVLKERPIPPHLEADRGVV